MPPDCTRDWVSTRPSRCGPMLPRRASVNERGGTDVLVPGYPLSLRAGCQGGRRRADADARGRWPMRCARSTTPWDPQRLAEQASASGAADEPDHAASIRQRPGALRRSAVSPASSSPRSPKCCPPTSRSLRRSSTRSRSR